MVCLRKLRQLFQLYPYFKANYRLVFTERRLEIDKYRSRRLTWASQRIVRVNSMQERVRDDDKHISPQNLGDFLAIVEDEDLDLLDAAVRKFNKQRGGETNTQETNVMMAYYCLNKPDRALAMLRDEQLSNYFRQVTSHIVAMQLLYNVKRYREIIDIYKSYQRLETGFSSVCTTLVMASCYLLNTRDSLKTAVDILDDIRDKGGSPIPRQAALASGLALRQGRYRLAADMCGRATLPRLNVIMMGCAVRSIQLISLAKSGKISEAVNLLSQYTFTKVTPRSPSICRESVDELMELVQTGGSQEDKEEVIGLYNRLEEEGRFDQLKLHELLLEPIDLRPTPRILEAKAMRRETLMGRRARRSVVGI